MATNWTKNELNAYLLIYCANADFTENIDEIDFIKKEVGEDIYKKIHKEFNGDNDYQSVQKIQDTLNHHSFSETEIEELIEEIKNLFIADGNFDIQEHNLFNGLKKILKY